MSTVSTRPHLRIGGASGFWGDSSLGAPQLVNSGLIDVLDIREPSRPTLLFNLDLSAHGGAVNSVW